jgi:hypothetical protein
MVRLPVNMSEPGDLRITIGFYFCMVTTCACIWWSALLAEGVRLPMGRESLLCDLRMRPCLQFLRCASVFCLRERACLASNTLQTPTSCAPFVGAYNCECSFCKQGASRGHACLARALQVISLVGRHDVLHVYAGVLAYRSILSIYACSGVRATHVSGLRKHMEPDRPPLFTSLPEVQVRLRLVVHRYPSIGMQTYAHLRRATLICLMFALEEVRVRLPNARTVSVFFRQSSCSSACCSAVLRR